MFLLPELYGPDIVLDDLLEDLFLLILVDPLYPLDRLLPVLPLQVLHLPPQPLLLLLLLLHTHDLALHLLSLVHDALLPLLLHLLHVQPHLLPVLVLGTLLRQPLLPLLLCPCIQLTLAFFGYLLVSKEVLAFVLLQELVLLLY